ncbi:hypothetical protein PQX77_016295 [Marasmius sp. AFHP31]|nr:hypothetical protein PQX77_016295 [Marasmius sp. AFHP31]
MALNTYLSSSEFLVYALAFGVALFIAYLRPRHPLSDIPGPFLARYTDLWQVYYARIGRRHMAVHEAHKKYGPLVRIAPNHLSVADFDLVPIIYASGPKSLDKSPYYKAFISGSEPSIFSTVDRNDHAKKRRFYTGTFAPKTVKEYGPLVFSVMGRLLEKLDQKCGEDHIDLMRHVNYFALDALSTLAFGESLGTLEKARYISLASK